MYIVFFYFIDKKIKYIFFDNEINFMESWYYCKKEFVYLFLFEDF